MVVRPARPSDLETLVLQRSLLWPDGAEDHRGELARILSNAPYTVLPMAVLVAELDGVIAGFVEVSLRSTVDGCDETRPAGFIEGWFVEERFRRCGVGRALIEAAETWSRAQGAVEIGSDALIENRASIEAHKRLGFEVVDECVNFKKTLTEAAPDDAFYGRALAKLHHEHFGFTARAAGEELLRRLGERRGTVVELAVGSGILSRMAVDAGFSAAGVDISRSMIGLCRELVPEAKLTVGSLWDFAVPPCVAVTAVGEAFCYAADPRAGLDALEARLRSIHDALEPGGLLLFDVAGPGRSTERASRHFFAGDAIICVDTEEEGRTLTRRITTLFPVGRLYERSNEEHVLRLYEPEEIEALLHSRRSPASSQGTQGRSWLAATSTPGPSSARVRS